MYRQNRSLETAWVLSAAYGFEQLAIREALLKIIVLENVQIENETEVSAALELTAHGLSFADALHLIGRPPGCGFVRLTARSFDAPSRWSPTGL